MKSIEIISCAKINLSIDVTGVDSEGFHTVDMMMQQLAFHDDVKISFATFATSPNLDERFGASGKFSVSIKTNRAYLPTNEKNIAYRAAELMISRYGDRKQGGSISIEIFKRIPVGAGLAGGSGNAAAVIHGLNVLWNLDLSLSDICKIGEELGADVPFCAIGQAVRNRNLPKKIRMDSLAASCARARGRGTLLKKTASIKKPVVIAKPRFGVSTATVYKGIDGCEIKERPDNDKLEGFLRERSGYMYDEFINVLENYTLDAYPQVRILKDRMMGTGARKVLMSGSGPTVFAVFDRMEDAKALSKALRKEKYESYWTHTTA